MMKLCVSCGQARWTLPGLTHTFPVLGTVTSAFARAAIKWAAAKRGKTGLPGHDSAIVELHKICLSVALYRARHPVVLEIL